MFLVGDTYMTLLSGAQTSGAFTLLEALVLPEAGPPPHAHHGDEETFVLLEGEMTFDVADQTYDARPVTVLYVPRGVAHSYSNVGTGPALMLLMQSPAGMEGMFAEIDKPGRRGAIPPPLDPDDITAMAGLADKYGFAFLTG